MSKWHGGKGSKQRPTDQKKFSDNWDNIFRKGEQDRLGIGDTCNICGKGHGGTGFYVEKYGRVCDQCGIKYRHDELGQTIS